MEKKGSREYCFPMLSPPLHTPGNHQFASSLPPAITNLPRVVFATHHSIGGYLPAVKAGTLVVCLIVVVYCAVVVVEIVGVV